MIATHSCLIQQLLWQRIWNVQDFFQCLGTALKPLLFGIFRHQCWSHHR
jgi:hypothetical protein